MCKKCKTMKTDENSNVEKVYLDGKAIEVVQEFCYLGDDSIGAKGGTVTGVIARVINGWRKFKTSAITKQQSLTTVDQGNNISDI